MIIVYRPSKTRFYRLLKRMAMSAEPYSSVLDFASAGAKNMAFFKGKKYAGADRNERLQREAGRRFGVLPGVKFLTADLLRPKIKERFDLVVSTNTLVYVKDKARAVRNLAGLVKPDGKLILQMDRVGFSQKIRGFLSRSFREIRIIPYRGILSRLFEQGLMKIFGTDNLGDLKFTAAGSRLMLLASLAFSCLDFIGRGDSVMIMCRRDR